MAEAVVEFMASHDFASHSAFTHTNLRNKNQAIYDTKPLILVAWVGGYYIPYQKVDTGLSFNIRHLRWKMQLLCYSIVCMYLSICCVNYQVAKYLDIKYATV